MRFIDNSLIPPPDNAWRKRASDAANAVNHGAKANDHGAVWRDCKNVLADASASKCWYCEARQERSDNAVDHFRPKGKLSKCPTAHEGYGWLAFDFFNYRYACTFCNSVRRSANGGETGGKGSEFPLMDESCRACSAEADIDLERPILLDPCCADDPMLLDFRADGSACPRNPNHEIRAKRVNESIRIYHLNHEGAKEQRRKLAVEIERKIKTGNKLYSESDSGDASKDSAFSEIARELKNYIAESSPYSSFAKSVLRGNRDHEWVDVLLTT